MTALAYIMIILGAATAANGVMRFICWIDR